MGHDVTPALRLESESIVYTTDHTRLEDIDQSVADGGFLDRTGDARSVEQEVRLATMSSSRRSPST